MLNRRFEYISPTDGTRHLGTIKFHDKLKESSSKKASDAWFGVEWDDAERGKHSGTHDGHTYFSTLQPNAGSFLRDTPKIRSIMNIAGVSFVNAFKQKYQQNGSDVTLVEAFGDTGVKVAFLGFDKTAQLQSKNAAIISEVGLAKLLISCAGSYSGAIHALCGGITDLDLSENLLSDFQTVADICSGLHELVSLRLNRNRFGSTSLSNSSKFQTLTALSLNGTLMLWKDVKSLASFMPQLEQLHFGFNRLTSLNDTNSAVFSHLETLSLEGNKLHDWSDIVAELTQMPKLSNLNLQSNEIRSLTPTNDHLKCLKILNLSRNLIDSWSSVDAVPITVRDLKMRECQVLTKDGLKEDMARIECVARLPFVTTLNGSAITEKERKNYEMYYLQQCVDARLANDWQQEQLIQVHPQFSNLAGKYGGEPVPINKKDEGKIKSSLISITVSVRATGMGFVKRLPTRTTVRTLKTVIQRHCKIPSADQHLILISNDGSSVKMDDVQKDVVYYCESSTPESLHISVSTE